MARLRNPFVLVPLGGAVLAAIVVVLVIFAVGGRGQGNKPTPEAPVATLQGKPRPAPEATVRQYYFLINDKQLDKAYGLLSMDSPARRPFDEWSQAFGETTSVDVKSAILRHSTDSEAEVYVEIGAVDVLSDGTEIERQFAGTWQLVWADGRWLLNTPSVRQTGEEVRTPTSTPTPTRTPTPTPTLTPTPQPLTIVVFLQGLGSQVFSGQEPYPANEFTEIGNAISAQSRGPVEFVYYSYAGSTLPWVVGATHEKPHPVDYGCPDSAQDPWVSAQRLDSLLDSLDSFWRGLDYDVRFVLVGHSLGGLVAVLGMQHADVKAVVTLDSPLMGIGSGKAFVAEHLKRFCSGPATDRLAGMQADPMWPQQQQARVASFQARGGFIATLGNEQDCLYDPSNCPAICLLVLCPLFTDETYTQIIPTADYHVLWSLGTGGSYGHNMILHDPSAVSYIAWVVAQSLAAP